MNVEDRRAAWNESARAALLRPRSAPLPPPVLHHALRSRWIPRTARAAVDAYWRAHPLRADALARHLAARSGAPPGWRWRLDADPERPASFRLPPLPYREPGHRCGPGRCVICGGSVFRLGWHSDRWGSGRSNGRAEWHACCVAAWRFWTDPAGQRKLLSRLQGRRCALSGLRLLRSAEVDHRTPLFRVWRDHRDRPWPELLEFWGRPNLQAVNRPAHARKSAEDARVAWDVEARAAGASTDSAA